MTSRRLLQKPLMLLLLISIAKLANGDATDPRILFLGQDQSRRLDGHGGHDHHTPIKGMADWKQLRLIQRMSDLSRVIGGDSMEEVQKENPIKKIAKKDKPKASEVQQAYLESIKDIDSIAGSIDTAMDDTKQLEESLTNSLMFKDEDPISIDANVKARRKKHKKRSIFRVKRDLFSSQGGPTCFGPECESRPEKFGVPPSPVQQQQQQQRIQRPPTHEKMPTDLMNSLHADRVRGPPSGFAPEFQPFYTRAPWRPPPTTTVRESSTRRDIPPPFNKPLFNNGEISLLPLSTQEPSTAIPPPFRPPQIPLFQKSPFGREDERNPSNILASLAASNDEEDEDDTNIDMTDIQALEKDAEDLLKVIEGRYAAEIQRLQGIDKKLHSLNVGQNKLRKVDAAGATANTVTEMPTTTTTATTAKNRLLPEASRVIGVDKVANNATKEGVTDQAAKVTVAAEKNKASVKDIQDLIVEKERKLEQEIKKKADLEKRLAQAGKEEESGNKPTQPPLLVTMPSTSATSTPSPTSSSSTTAVPTAAPTASETAATAAAAVDRALGKPANPRSELETKSSNEETSALERKMGFPKNAQGMASNALPKGLQEVLPKLSKSMLTGQPTNNVDKDSGAPK